MSSQVFPISFPQRRVQSATVPFGLTVLFLAALYSQIAVQIPAIDVLRPLYVIGAAAIVTLLIDLFMSRRTIEMVWPESYLLLGFLVAAGLSCLGALWQSFALQTFLDLLKPVALYFLLLHTVANERRLRIVLWVLILGSLFPALGTLRNHLTGVQVEGRSGWIGIFENPNELAYSLIILIPLAVYLATTTRGLKVALLWITIAVYVAAISLAFSRAGLVALLAVIALMGLWWRSGTAKLLMIAAFAGAVLFVAYGWTKSHGFTELGSDLSFQQRIASIRGGFAMFADHPLTGVGIGCSFVAWPLYAPLNLGSNQWLIIHNTFVQTLSETGLIGFAAFTLLLVTAILRARKIARERASLDWRSARLGIALQVALWGFVVCALSGGYALTWFVYILIALVSCTEKALRQSEMGTSAC